MERVAFSPAPPVSSTGSPSPSDTDAIRKASNRVLHLSSGSSPRPTRLMQRPERGPPSPEAAIQRLQERSRLDGGEGFKSIYSWARYQLDFLVSPSDAKSRVTGLCSVLDVLMPRICQDTDLWRHLRTLLVDSLFVDENCSITRSDQAESYEKTIDALITQLGAKRAALTAARRIANASLEKSVLTSVKAVFTAWRTFTRCERRSRRRLSRGLQYQQERMMKLKRFSWWRQLTLSAKLRRATRQQARGVGHRPATEGTRRPNVTPTESADIELLRRRLSEESQLRDRQFEAFSYEVSGLNADVTKLTHNLRQCQAQKALWRSLYLGSNPTLCLLWALPPSVTSACDALDNSVQKHLTFLSQLEVNDFVGIIRNATTPTLPKSGTDRRKLSSTSLATQQSRQSADEADVYRAQVRGRLETLLIQWVNSMLTRREEVMEATGVGGTETSSHVRTLTSLKEDLHDGVIYEALLDAIDLGTRCNENFEELSVWSEHAHGSEASIGRSKGMVAGARRLVWALQRAVGRGSGPGSCLPPWCQSVLSSCTNGVILRDVFEDESVLFGDVIAHMWVLSTLLIDFCVQLQNQQNGGRAMGANVRDASKFLHSYSRFYSPGAPKHVEGSGHTSFRSRSSQLITVASSESIGRSYEPMRPAPIDLLRPDVSQTSSRNLTARRSTVAPRGSFHTQPPRSNRPSIFDATACSMRAEEATSSHTVQPENNRLTALPSIRLTNTWAEELPPPSNNNNNSDGGVLPQISISMGFEDADEDIMETHSLGESGVFTSNRSLGWSAKGIDELLPTRIEGPSFFIDNQHTPMRAVANPAESLVHLRWYRESFDPLNPLSSTDYLRSDGGDGSRSFANLVSSEESKNEHPPFLTVPELMDTLEKDLVSPSYDAVQWHVVGLEIARRRSDWMTLGQVVALAIVGCRCLDAPEDNNIQSVLDDPSAVGMRSRQPSRNVSAEAHGQYSYTSGQRTKRSLSNSHRSASVGSNKSSSVTSGQGNTASRSPQTVSERSLFAGRGPTSNMRV